jgi:predicted choloylglycine hydrolase
MSYNHTMLDESGSYLTAHLRPGHPAEFRERAVATNHRWDKPLDPAHAARYRSVERADELSRMVAAQSSAAQIGGRLLRPPLHTTAYEQGFGTLYTAVYRPADRQVTYRWPDRTWVRGFDSPDESIDVSLPRP